MLMLKLQRRGKKHQASYRLIVGEKRTKLNGKQVEELGWFDPHQDKYEFKKERILYWLKIGAKMSDTVNNLLVRTKMVDGKKIAVHKKAAPKIPQGGVKTEKLENPAGEAPVSDPAEEANFNKSEEVKSDNKPAESQVGLGENAKAETVTP